MQSSRDVYSAYADYEQRFGELSVKLGVRLEKFHVRARLGGNIVY